MNRIKQLILLAIFHQATPTNIKFFEGKNSTGNFNSIFYKFVNQKHTKRIVRNWYSLKFQVISVKLSIYGPPVLMYHPLPELKTAQLKQIPVLLRST